MTSSDLPDPVARFVEAAGPGGGPNPDTVLFEGRGRFRRRPLPWLPMKVRIHVVPGSGRVMDMLIGLGPITVMRGLDAYVDGRGLTRVAGSAVVGPEVDQGAFHTIVIETMMLPATWSRMPGMRWEALDATRARLLVAFGDGTEVATVGFDGATGFPRSYEVPRFKGRGPKVGWRVDMLEWQRFGPLWSPGRIVVTWADEPGPWYIMWMERVELDADVVDVFRRARAALAQAPRA